MEYLKDPRFRFIAVFFILAVMILYTFFFREKDINIIPSVNAIYASPTGGKIEHQGREYNTLSIDNALSQIKTGHTLYLFPGSYRSTIRVSLKGLEEKPVSIIGAPGAELSGDTCIELNGADWVIIEKLSFNGCRTAAIRIEDSENIYIHQNRFEKSRHGVSIEDRRSGNIVVDSNEWTGKGPQTFVHGMNSKGELVVRSNTVSGGAHGVWLRADDDLDPKLTNVNVQIYENNFSGLITALRAEKSAINWWIHKNEFRGGREWISFYKTAGGYHYVFSNVGVAGELNRSHSVMSLPTADAKPLFPIFIFQNTWNFNNNYISNSGPLTLVQHFNNILRSTVPKPKILTRENWAATLQFNHDLINRRVIPPNAKAWTEAVFDQPRFTDEKVSDFSLNKQSPAIDRGIKIKLGEWTSEFYGDAPDIGAFESNTRIKGPKFFRRQIR